MAGPLLLALSTLLPSVLAIDDLLPNHAVPKTLIGPPNVMVMTPQDTKPQFERQLFDLGSPESRFSKLKRIAERQTTCLTGHGTCSNDPGTCCPLGGRCCGGGNCCSSGYSCVVVNGQVGCCPVGGNCAPPPLTASTPPLSTAAVPPAATKEKTSTHVPPRQTSTIVISVTSIRNITQVQTLTQTFGNPTSSVTPTSTAAQSTSTRSVETGAALSSSSTRTTNVGAIAGGAAAGVVAAIILVVILIIWRRRQSQQPAVPAIFTITAPLDHSYDSTGAMPPTPGTADPFLTPMTQNQNLGVSYFNDETSGANSASQYPGLPEPYHSDNAGGMAMGAEAAMAMPTPRRDSHTSRPLPMSVVHDNSNYSSGNNPPGSGSPCPWSGHPSGPPSFSTNPDTYMPQSDPSGWSNPGSSVNVGHAPYAAGAASSGHVPDRQGQVETASTIYQPSSYGGYNESLLARTPPPASPPPDVYGGIASSSVDVDGKGAGSPGSGLPKGAAPPATYVPGEK